MGVIDERPPAGRESSPPALSLLSAELTKPLSHLDDVGGDALDVLAAGVGQVLADLRTELA
jgi:hypothetical protein